MVVIGPGGTVVGGVRALGCGRDALGAMVIVHRTGMQRRRLDHDDDEPDREDGGDQPVQAREGEAHGQYVCPIRADVSGSETDGGWRGAKRSKARMDGVALPDRGLQDHVMGPIRSTALNAFALPAAVALAVLRVSSACGTRDIAPDGRTNPVHYRAASRRFR